MSWNVYLFMWKWCALDSQIIEWRNMCEVACIACVKTTLLCLHDNQLFVYIFRIALLLFQLGNLWRSTKQTNRAKSKLTHCMQVTWRHWENCMMNTIQCTDTPMSSFISHNTLPSVQCRLHYWILMHTRNWPGIFLSNDNKL